MTTRQGTCRDGGMVPLACTLTPADLAAQCRRWRRLAARALAARAETIGGLRLCFRDEPEVADELRRLVVVVESQCCRWARWSVQARSGRIVLEIHAAGEGVAALHSMFTGLRPPAGGAQRVCGGFEPTPRRGRRSNRCLCAPEERGVSPCATRLSPEERTMAPRDAGQTTDEQRGQRIVRLSRAAADHQPAEVEGRRHGIGRDLTADVVAPGRQP